MAKDTELPEGEGEQIVAPEEPQEPQPEIEQEPEADPVEGIAHEMGWVPKDKFKGKEEDWKPAADYIREGKNIQKGLSRDLKDVKSQMETMARTSAAILQDRLGEERQRLAAQYQQAVDEGDPDKSWAISQRINSVDNRLQQTNTPAPNTGTAEWVARNGWYNTHPIARAMALETAELHARAGKPPHEQLEAAEAEVRRAYPHLFGAPQKQAPGVSQPGSRSAAPSNRAKTFADMPRPAQDVAKDMVERGVIKSVEDYSRNYWASEGKAR